ncbi:hypothetical protein Aab01nite_31800 [Paractinoplanes abujensis]|uniref:Serine/threonine protein phosphatase PrpC n=1 Tax=Paractinoplanes abujensis TaxID=882441 RepID=A0A7W7G507_9ACTN|nr:PP2C family serine/threonine-protein phosphatase [Actinoplanes abujensis]MBB4697928.1 serine/threonine protein phosphatase PrpC [Actinoplanes abujensis]GID19590.1 hypothetical protein Aab01nite_31800 [Actinoplanes abujensis]
MPDQAGSAWRVVARKAIGASHVRAQRENQDSIGFLPPGGAGAGVAVTVADGHGSAVSFRSAAGSRLAVQASHDLAQELLNFAPTGADRSVAKRQIEERAGEQLVRRWRELVEEELVKDPFEKCVLFGELDPENRRRVAADPYLAYGSTVVTAVVTDAFMAFWQIGDGDLVVVGADGGVFRPLPADPNLFANATTSLCSTDAARYFRSAWWSGKTAPLVLASTDGLSNSYESDEGFLAFGRDILRQIVTHGLDTVEGRLEEWLSEISERGSGDDMSLGLICRPASLPEAVGAVLDNPGGER